MLKDGKTTSLADGRKFLGYRESAGELTDIVLTKTARASRFNSIETILSAKPIPQA